MVTSIIITTIYNKMLTICKKNRGRVATWNTLPKKGNGWMYIMDEKRWFLNKLGGRK